MRRLLILLALVSALAIGALLSPIIENPAVLAQVNTFCASNLACTVTAPWMISKLGNASGYTCYIDGTTWTSIQSAITNGTCGEINDRASFSTTLGALTINRQVKILLGPSVYTFTGMTISVPSFIVEGINNATWLSYTPTTGNAIAFTSTTSANVEGAGFRDVRITGSGTGNATVGMFYNQTVDSHHKHHRIQIDNFGTGLSANGSASSGLGFVTFLSSSIFANGQNVNIPSGATGERLEFIDSNINNLLNGTNWSNCFNMAATGVNVRMVGGALDYCQMNVSAGFLEMGDATYVEDSNVVLGTCTTAAITGCAIAVSGTGQVTLNTMLAAMQNTNQSFLGVTGNGTLNINGGSYSNTAASGGQPITCVTGNGNLSINPIPTLTNYANIWQGGCFRIGTNNPNGSTPGNIYGIPASAILAGNAADVAIINANGASGGKNWLCPVSAATGSFAGTAGDEYCYDGTSNWIEFGSGVNGLKVPTGFLRAPNNTVALTADWTCGTGGTVSSCVAATIIGSGGGVPLTFTLPLQAASYTLVCDGVTGQATAATANQWNLLTATNGATNVTANYSMATAATASAYGAVTDQASTTTTFQITPSWTLGGTGTKMPFRIWAKIEAASASGTVVSLQLLAPTVGDLVTIYRGTACRVF